NGRNRTFFLFSEESYRQILGNTKLSRVPTDLERGADFSATGVLKDPLGGNFANGRIPASRLSPIALKVAAFFPRANRVSANNSITAINDRASWDSILMKFDQHFNSNNILSFRYTKRFNRTSNPFNGSDLGTFGNRVGNHQSLTGLTFTHMFTPTV